VLHITRLRTDIKQKSNYKDQKVDDEDGHYIVVPEADLTERCTFQLHLNLLTMLTHRQTRF
jgi:phosphotransferase system IIB component